MRNGGDDTDVKFKGGVGPATENESPTYVLPLPSEFTDSSRLSRLKAPPLAMPTDPSFAEPQLGGLPVPSNLPLIPALKPNCHLS